MKIVRGEPGDFFAPPPLRRRLKALGFQVFNTRTGEAISEVFKRRAPARAALREEWMKGVLAGIRSAKEET